jgi:D-alanyl-D-alanine carboxypeptidase/D-alanyl-D-alanine-endopeptidase (penicillin-binding protein 4)
MKVGGCARRVGALTVTGRVRKMARVRTPRVALLAAALALVLATPAGSTVRDARTPLQRRLAQALAVPHLDPSREAAVAADLSTGEVLFERNPTLSLAPASTEKLAVTLAALSALGPSFRIETQVLGEGEQIGAVWDGDLVLQGHGDPTLSSADLRSLAAQVRAAGIRRVTGGVAGDESWFDARRTAPGWMAYFYVFECPPLSALSVDRGRYRGQVASEPALAAALAFRDALQSAGVAVAGKATARPAGEYAYPLASVASPALWALVRSMDRTSDNFAAELLLKELGAVVRQRGTTAAGAQVVRSELETFDVPMAGVRIVDGSGLSRLDRLTANALVAILAAAWLDPTVRKPLLGALPVAGVNGTLEDRMRRPPARGHVLAKTGTTREASALSGFVRDRYVFAVLQNGWPVSFWWARRAQDRFATVLAAQ